MKNKYVWLILLLLFSLVVGVFTGYSFNKEMAPLKMNGENDDVLEI